MGYSFYKGDKSWILKELIMIIMMVMIILSGCSKNGPPGKTVIRYNNPESLPELVKLMNDIIQAFEKENPDIEIRLEFAGGSLERIITQMAGGVAPDVFFWWTNPDVLIEKGQLLPLNSYIKKYNVNLSDYYEQTIDFMSKEGNIYGMPLQFKTMALVFNRDFFDKAGLSYPNDEWTWEEFYNTAKILTKDTNGDGRRDKFGALEVVGPSMWVKLNGGRLFDFEKGESLVLSDKRTQEALRFYKRYVDDTSPTPSEAESIGVAGGAGIASFCSGWIGMVICPNYYIRTISLSKDLNWDVSPIPKSPDGVRRQLYEVGGLCISAHTKHPDEAFKFAKFYTEKRGMEIFGKAKNGIPAHKEVSEIFLAGPPSGMKYFVSGLDNAVRFPERSDMVKSEIKEEVIKEFWMEYDLYLRDSISFEDMMANGSKRMERKFGMLIR